MLTYLKSPMRVQRIPMHLSSGHLTLMPGKFYPFPSKFPSPIGLWAPNGLTSSFATNFYFFIFFPREISEFRGSTGVKFCTMVNSKLSFIMPVQNFGGHTLKKFQEPKTSKIWLDFGRLQCSAANISGADKDIQNR